jgi:hypothetical protein
MFKLNVVIYIDKKDYSIKEKKGIFFHSLFISLCCRTRELTATDMLSHQEVKMVAKRSQRKQERRKILMNLSKKLK